MFAGLLAKLGIETAGLGLKLAIFGSIIAAFFAYTGVVYVYGRVDGKNSCQVAVYQKTIDEQKKQLNEANKILERDSKKYVEMESELNKLKEQIDATPENTGDCLDPAAGKRVYNIK